MQIIIPGDPIPKARHRSCIVAGKISTYDSQHKEKKKTISFLKKFINQIQDGEDLELQKDLESVLSADHFEVHMTFYLKIPQSSSKKKQDLMAKNDLKHASRPDLDNLIKMILDCANTIIWPDDKQIVKISAEKRFSRVPFTLLHIFGTNADG